MAENEDKFRKVLADTQRDQYIPDLEDHWDKAIKHYAKAYFTDAMALVDQRIESKKRDMVARGDKPNQAELARIREKFRRKFISVHDKITKSLAIVEKVPNTKDPKGFELNIRIGLDDNIKQNDREIRGCYLKVEMPQGYSRQKFVDIFNEELRIYNCRINNKNALKPISEEVVDGVAVRTCIIPLSEVLFPEKEKGR